MARKRAAKTPEEQEKINVSLAVKLAEQQLREGTAPPSVIAHYLRLGSSLFPLEKEQLERQNALLKAKEKNIESMTRMEELYHEGLAALRHYAGAEEEEDA